MRRFYEHEDASTLTLLSGARSNISATKIPRSRQATCRSAPSASTRCAKPSRARRCWCDRGYTLAKSIEFNSGTTVGALGSETERSGTRFPPKALRRCLSEELKLRRDGESKPSLRSVSRLASRPAFHSSHVTELTSSILHLRLLGRGDVHDGFPNVHACILAQRHSPRQPESGCVSLNRG